MSEKWISIVDFPRYEVSNFGGVLDTRYDRYLVKTLVQKAIPTVGLVKDRILYRRSVPLLVATHWLANDIGSPFDTPIHLDGDRSNCFVGNLLWRPRWFAIQYHREKLFEEAMPNVKVVCSKTGEVFESIRDASIYYGFMERDIIKSLRTDLPVWPDKVVFELY